MRESVSGRVWRSLCFALVLTVLPLLAPSAHAARWKSAGYLYRYFVWGPVFLVRQIRGVNALIDEYGRYPVHTINNAPPGSHFAANSRYTLPVTIEYRDGDSTMQSQLDPFLESTGTTSFIVVKDGALVYERYFNGHRRDSLCVSQSVAKSFTSALMGIAINEGAIKSLDDSVRKYLPELNPRVFDPITIRDLLDMGSGLAYTVGHFPWDDEPLFTFSLDLRALPADMTVNEPPGQSFRYNNYNTLLLGMVLERTTHRTPSQLLEEKIWQPLGMEYPASWCVDSEQDGFELMAGGLNARAIDYAKFGQLYLNEGSWNGSQIVPQCWVVESTTEDAGDTRPWRTYPGWQDLSGYYKYHWWGIQRGQNDYAFTAIGDYGQFIYVYPKKNLVIVRTGDKWGVPFFVWPQIFHYLADRLNQAVTETSNPVVLRR